MNHNLGYVLWWRVAGEGLSHDAVERAINDPALLPHRPLPVDVFRRVTGSATSRYTIGEDTHLELSTVFADAPSDKLMVRNIIATVTNDKGVVQTSQKVGDAVFYRPPRGKADKGRMRVTTNNVDPAWKSSVAAFTKALQHRYKVGTSGHLDSQAIRRIVRNCLSKAGALYLDGPYFVLETEPLQPLQEVFGLLGEESSLYTLPFPADPERHAVLTRFVERAVAQGLPVDEDIWHRLEMHS